MNTAAIEAEALGLEPVERLRLANLLLVSVETKEEQENLQKWETEADERWEAYRRGDLKTISGEEVADKMREVLSGK